MSNYTLNNVRRFITHIDEADYWDMHLNADSPGNGGLVDDCLGVFIDTTDPECLKGDGLTSLPEYFYDGYCNNGLILDNIGYTGVDNGLITYRKDRISNDEFYRLYTDSEYSIESGDTRLHLNKVSGNTCLYDYPTSLNDDGSVKLNGGFYQGFFRSANKYQVLPSSIKPGSEWNLSFKLRKVDYEPESEKTLNDKYPDNKGIFFYMGTRAENKWIYLYDEIPLSGTSYDICDPTSDDSLFDLFEEEMVLSAQTFDTDNGFSISSPNDAYIMSDNKFLIFSRGCGGVTLHDYTGNEIAMLTYKKNRFDGNLFLYMSRACSGYTVHDIEKIESGYSETYKDETFYGDIYNNAFALMIKDDGSIGYRYIVKNCDNPEEKPYKILEGFSYPGMVKEDEWFDVRVRIKASTTGMKLYFYINGKLKYITRELPSFNFRKLDEMDEKQEGVAYNISLGGGTQGLAETIMPEYMLKPTKTFPLEMNFAGSFIGDISEFKFHTC